MATVDDHTRDKLIASALRRCPGRESIETLRSLLYLFEDEPMSEDIYRALERAIDVLERLRAAAHGGPVHAQTRHWNVKGE
jgi:hypothetical protein